VQVIYDLQHRFRSLKISGTLPAWLKGNRFQIQLAQPSGASAL